MKILRVIFLTLALGTAAVALAADPSGTWQWATRSPNGAIETTLTLESKNGTLTGAYSNQFGRTAISEASLHDDVITFNVVRNLGGKPYVVKYRGKLEDDVITGTIEAPGHDGGEPVTLEWKAKRAPAKQADDAKSSH